MLSKFVKVGNKIELQAVDKRAGNEINKTYASRVLDVMSEDTMEIAMPMEQTKLILLPVDSEYNMILYGENGLYQCFARVVDRYKSNNIYILVVTMTSNLRRYQRREYYRFSCALDMCTRSLEEDEMQALEKSLPCILQPSLPLKHSVIVDISGGGLRFISEQKYDVNSFIYCSYHLVIGGQRKKYEVVSRVLAARELDNKPGNFEHRVKYHNLEKEVREEIIKFVFEEERKSLKRDRL